MNVMSEYETIRFEIRGNVAWVTLNRPQVLNAINLAMQAELVDVWQRIRKAPDIHVSVLTGAGERAFTTGADREEMAGTINEEPATPLLSSCPVPRSAVPGGPGVESDIGERIAPKSQMCWKPVIAAVNGMACGGAFYLLGECDIIIASETATFFDPHVTYGMVSAYESIHMLQRMPIGEVLRMQLLGNYERLSAQRAWQIGLVSEVVRPAQLHDAADWVASRIASLSPAAIQGTLRAVWAAKEVSRQAALDLSPHFIAMANPAEWTAGQDTFHTGERVKPRIR